MCGLLDVLIAVSCNLIVVTIERFIKENILKII
jgi:hypothetical protein